MSNVVDNRVVSMEFDNSKFEKNVETSLGTLRHLDDSLNKIDGASFDKLSGSVDAIANKFTFLGTISRRIFETMADDVINAGKRMVSGFTIDQMSSGWDKYAEKTTSVQTIMSATGDSIEYVTDQLEKLNWFTDETSYNFTDMTSNIAKFTSQGIALDDAVNEMQGIALWAASAGQNAQAASRAMYNISQAMGAGSMKLIDWKSIQNANMATKEFKEQAIEAAVAVGSLAVEGDHWVTVAKGTEVTLKNFDQTLSEGWLNSAAMETVFNKYGMFAEALYDLSDASGLTATELLEMYDCFKNGGDIQDEFANELNLSNISAEELIETFELLNTEGYELGEKAFRLGQEAKTFGDAMDATADATSTAWMNLFETIFGNYEQQKKIWTDLAVYMYDWFAEPINKATSVFRQAMFNLRDGLSGRDLLFDPDFGAFYNLLNIVTAIGEVVSRAWNNVFTGDKVELVYNFIDSLQQGTGAVLSFLTDSEEESHRLERILSGVFSLLDIGKQAVVAIFDGAKSILQMFGFVGEGALEGAAGIADWITALDQSIKENQIFGKGVRYIVDILGKFISIALDAAGKVKELYNKIKDLEQVQKVANWIEEHFNKALEKIPELVDKASKWLNENFNSALEAIPGLVGLACDALLIGFDSILNFFTKTIPNWYRTIVNYISNFDFSKILNFFNDVKDAVIDLFNMIKQLVITGDWEQFVDAFTERFPKISEVISNVKDAISKFFSYISEKGPPFLKRVLAGLITLISVLLTIKTVLTFNKLLDSLSGFLDTIGDVLSGVKKAPKILAIVGIAAALAVIIYEVKMLSEIPEDDLKRALIAIGIIGGILVALEGIAAIAAGLKLDNGVSTAGTGVLKFAASLGIIALALIGLSNLPLENLGASIITMVGIMAALTLAATFMSKHALTLSVGGSGLIMYALAVLVLAKALKEIQDNAEGLSIEAFKTLIGIMAALAVLSFVIKGVKFGGALGILLLAFSLVQIEKALMNAIDNAIPFETFKQYWKELLSIVTILAGFALITRLTGKGSIKGILSLLALIGLLYLLPGIIQKFGDIPSDQLWQGVATIAIIGAVLAGILATTSMIVDMSKEGLKSLKWLIIGIAAILVALYFLKDSTMDELLPAVIAIGTVMVALGVAIGLAMTPISKSSSIDGKAIAGLVIILVAIGGVIAALWWLSTQDLPALPQVAYALAAVMVALGVALFAVGNKWYEAPSFVEAIQTMFQALLILAPVIGALWALQQFGIEASIETVGALSLLLVALAGCMVLLSLTKSDWKQSIANGAALAVASTSLIAIAFALSLMKDINLDGVSSKILILGGVLIELSICLAIMSLIPSPAALGPALLGLIGIIAIIAVLMIAVANLGPDNDKMMEVAPKVTNGFALLGEAIGAFIGGFLGGIGIGMTHSMIQMAENLCTFAESLQPFLNSVGQITDQQVQGMDALTALMLKLAAAELINALSNILNGFGLFKNDLGDKLNKFAGFITDYLDALKNVSLEDVQKGIALTDALTILMLKLAAAELLNSFANILNGFGLFKNDLGDKLKKFAGSITDYLVALKNVSLEDVQKGTALTESFAKLFQALPQNGGIFQIFTGNTDLKKFAKQIAGYGEALASFCTSISGIDEGSTSQASVASALTDVVVEIADKLPKVSGEGLAFFTSTSQPKKFGEGMASYMNSLVSITDSASSLNATDIMNLLVSKALTDVVVEIGDTIPEMSSTIKSWFSDYIDYSKFGSQMSDYISSLVEITNSASAIDSSMLTNIDTAKAISIVLVGIAEMIPDVQSWVQSALFTHDDQGLFGKRMSTFMQNLVISGNAAGEIPTDAIHTISFAKQTTESLIDLLKIIPSSSIFSNNSLANTGDVVVFGNSIRQFAVAMKAYVEEISGLNASDVEKTTEYLTTITTELLEVSGKFRSIGLDVGSVVNSFDNALLNINKTCDDILIVIIDFTGKFEEAGTNLIAAYIKGIKANQNGGALTAGSEVARDVLSGLSNEDWEKTGTAVVVSYVGGIMNERHSLIETGRFIIEMLIEGLEYSGQDASYSYGQYFAIGFADGMYDQISYVQSAAADLGYAAAEALAAAAQIYSPSRIAKGLGGYFGEGWIIGIQGMYSAAEDAAEGLAGNTIDAVAYAKEAAENLLNSDYDPVIRPIIDLSEVESAVNSIPQFDSVYSVTGAYKAAETGVSIDEARRIKQSSINANDSIINNLNKYLDTDRDFNVSIRVDKMAVRSEEDITAISKQLAKEVRVALRQKPTR